MSPQTNLIIIESHHRNTVNHRHSWYVMRQLLQLNATLHITDDGHLRLHML
jgi:hypothetical protein